jgi:exonuclease VII small subunit
LLAATPTTAQSLDRNRTISQLQGIINELERVQNGTTSYMKAQELLLQAKSKLNQLSSQLPK